MMSEGQIVREMAAVAFAQRVLGDRGSLRPRGDEPALDALPVDSEPWSAGTVSLQVESQIEEGTIEASFHVFVAGNDVVSVEAIVGLAESYAARALPSAAQSPLVGKPRRPSRIISGSESGAKALRRVIEQDHPALANLIECEVGDIEPAMSTARAYLEARAAHQDAG